MVLPSDAMYSFTPIALAHADKFATYLQEANHEFLEITSRLNCIQILVDHRIKFGVCGYQHVCHDGVVTRSDAMPCSEPITAASSFLSHRISPTSPVFSSFFVSLRFHASVTTMERGGAGGLLGPAPSAKAERSLLPEGHSERIGHGDSPNRAWDWCVPVAPSGQGHAGSVGCGARGMDGCDRCALLMVKCSQVRGTRTNEDGGGGVGREGTSSKTLEWGYYGE